MLLPPLEVQAVEHVVDQPGESHFDQCEEPDALVQHAMLDPHLLVDPQSGIDYALGGDVLLPPARARGMRPENNSWSQERPPAQQDGGMEIGSAVQK